MPRPKDRAPAVRAALDSLKCQHDRDSTGRDRETGDFFCIDCGDVLIPWAQQTERQHKRYVWEWGQEPPAHKEAGNG